MEDFKEKFNSLPKERQQKAIKNITNYLADYLPEQLYKGTEAFNKLSTALSIAKKTQKA